MKPDAPALGIDLGGTKIGARLFDAARRELWRERIVTPQSGYGETLAAIAGLVGRARVQVPGAAPTVGIGTPGSADAAGRIKNANSTCLNGQRDPQSGLAEPRNGLILVTGATGSGKSTTLAAVLDIINQTRAVHVVTLEDPLEFIHPVKMATFNQRELGTDFDTFANGLRAALRQAPKVILVGEMRDRETLEIGLAAAETGHLVVSTLHTMDSGQTVNRMLGMFDTDEERQIRMRLAATLRWIVCQRLLPKVGGGRVAALEVMGMNLRIQEIILNGESETRLGSETLWRTDLSGVAMAS